MNDVKNEVVDPGLPKVGDPTHLGGGFASGGYVGRPLNIHGYGYRAAPTPGATVSIDYMAFLEQAKAIAVKEVLFKVLEAVEAVKTSVKNTHSYGYSNRDPEEVKKEITAAIKTLM